MINFFLDLDLVKIEPILFKKERIFYERKRKKINAVRDHNFKKFRAQTPREKNGRREKKNWKGYILLERRISTMLVARKYRSKGKFASKGGGQRSETRFNSIPHDPSCQFRSTISRLHGPRETRDKTIHHLRAITGGTEIPQQSSLLSGYHVSKILFSLRDDAFKLSNRRKVAIRN